MVKRKSCFYHLAESLPLTHAFQSSQQTWLLHVEICFSGIHDEPIVSECGAVEPVERLSDGNNGKDVADSAQFRNFDWWSRKSNMKGQKKMRKIKGVLFLGAAFLRLPRVASTSKRKRKKRKNLKSHRSINCPEKCSELAQPLGNQSLDLFASKDEDGWRKELLPVPEAETPSRASLESISVSGLIRKYFPCNDEVTSGCSLPVVKKIAGELRARVDYDFLNMHLATPSSPVTKLPQETLHQPLHDELSSISSKAQHKTPEVGKRLMVAAGSLGLSARKRNSVHSICKYRDRVSVMPKSTAFVRSLVFEISDEND